MPAVNYFWDPDEDNIVKEFDDGGNTIADYTTEPFLYGDVISQRRSGVSHFYHFDTQGNTTELTDINGDTTDTRRYSAFGESTESTGSTTFPFQYMGQRGVYQGGFTGDYVARPLIYSPTSGRLLSPQDDNAYRIASNPLIQLVAFPAGTAALCRVQLACVHIAGGSFNLGPLHCGLEVQDAGGITRYHVPGIWSCAIAKTRVTFGPLTQSRDYYVVQSWSDTTGALCRCVHSVATAINAHANANVSNMPYKAVPSNNDKAIDCNTCGGTYTSCNSNYVTHCMMKSCNIDYTGWWGREGPAGWNHRMSSCALCSRSLRPELNEWGFCWRCRCDAWTPIDWGWCADAPTSPMPPSARPFPVF